MRDFLCGFTTAEVNYLHGNAVTDSATAAAEAHDTFMEHHSTVALDLFMEALGVWRESAEYPFKTVGGR